MTHQYLVKGITCGGCVSNVKRGLEELPGVVKADVQMDVPQATITMEKHIDTSVLQQAAKKYGNYELSELH